MSKKATTLDVREDLARGREPFSRIMQTAAAVKPGEQFRLIAPFEPAPMIAVLGQQGFSHQSRTIESGDWEVVFTRVTPGAGASGALAASAPAACTRRPVAKAGVDTLEVDARGLEPPEPLVKILEAVAALPSGTELVAYTDRRPMHLYPRLEERGFVGASEEQKDGSFITRIRRNS